MRYSNSLCLYYFLKCDYKPVEVGGEKGLKLWMDVDAKKVGGGLNLNKWTSTRKKIVNHKLRATDIKDV